MNRTILLSVLVLFAVLTISARGDIILIHDSFEADDVADGTESGPILPSGWGEIGGTTSTPHPVSVVDPGAGDFQPYSGEQYLKIGDPTNTGWTWLFDPNSTTFTKIPIPTESGHAEPGDTVTLSVQCAFEPSDSLKWAYAEARIALSDGTSWWYIPEGLTGGEIWPEDANSWQELSVTIDFSEDMIPADMEWSQYLYVEINTQTDSLDYNPVYFDDLTLSYHRAPTGVVNVSKTSVSVSEGGVTDEYTVELESQPTSDVEIFVSSENASGDRIEEVLFSDSFETTVVANGSEVDATPPSGWEVIGGTTDLDAWIVDPLNSEFQPYDGEQYLKVGDRALNGYIWIYRPDDPLTTGLLPIPNTSGHAEPGDTATFSARVAFEGDGSADWAWSQLRLALVNNTEGVWYVDEGLGFLPPNGAGAGDIWPSDQGVWHEISVTIDFDEIAAIYGAENLAWTEGLYIELNSGFNGLDYVPVYYDDVVLTYSRIDPATISWDLVDVTVNGSSTDTLTFTPTDYGPKTVLVAAVQDTDAEPNPHSEVILHSVTQAGGDGEFDGITIDVEAVITEDDCGAGPFNYYDVTGPLGEPDCVVNLLDFAEFSAAWMDCGIESCD
jgi:hypothetical protein